MKLSAIILLPMTLVWFPYLFDAVYNWDESSFIVAGNSLLSGNLPYTKLWDCKPPLIFFFSALCLAIYKSVISIRLGMLFLVAVSALLVFLVSKQLKRSDYEAAFAAALFGFFCCAYPGGPSLFTEHLALVPLSIGLLITLRDPSKNLFLAGLMMGLAFTARSNLAYLGIGLGIYHVCMQWKSGNPRLFIQKIISYSLGCLVPVLFFLALFEANGVLSNLYRGVVSAAIAHTGNQSLLNLELIHRSLKVLEQGFYLDSAFIWLSFLAGVGLNIKYKVLSKQHSVVLAVFFGSIFFSIVQTRVVRPHHTLQLFPIMMLFCSLSLWQIRRLKWGKPILTVLLLVGIGAPLRIPAQQAGKLFTRLSNSEGLLSDNAYKTCDYLSANNASGKPVYFMTHHICQVLSKTAAVTPVIHPSNLVRAGIVSEIYNKPTSSLTELNLVFSKKPLYVVRPAHINFLKKHPEVKNHLEIILKKKYVLTKEIGSTHIYRIRNF